MILHHEIRFSVRSYFFARIYWHAVAEIAALEKWRWWPVLYAYALWCYVVLLARSPR